MAFDFFLNGERITAINYNRSYNRLSVENSDFKIDTIILNKDNFQSIELWNGLKLDFNSFKNYLVQEL